MTVRNHNQIYHNNKTQSCSSIQGVKHWSTQETNINTNTWHDMVFDFVCHLFLSIFYAPALWWFVFFFQSCLSVCGSQIPRIILTHPSVSDEDVELLTQSSSSRELPHNSDIPDRHVNPDCFDCAFYPPWPPRLGTLVKDADCYYYLHLRAFTYWRISFILQRDQCHTTLFSVFLKVFVCHIQRLTMLVKDVDNVEIMQHN